MKDSGAANDLNCRDLTQDLSEKNVSLWPRDSSCDILMKNGTSFSSCPKKNMPEAKLKSYGLVALAKEMSKQPSIDSVVWLLAFILMKIYNEVEGAEQGKI